MQNTSRVASVAVLASTLAIIGTSCGGGANENTTVAARWARTVVPPGPASRFEFVATDRQGNIYVAGDLWGVGTVDFGNQVTANWIDSEKPGLLVKYDAAGTPQWARGGGPGYFGPVQIDSVGNIYMLANLSSATSGTLDFGNSVTVTKSDARSTCVLVKHDSSGTVTWAETVTDALGNAGYDVGAFGLAVDAAGNAYVAGNVADEAVENVQANILAPSRGARILAPAAQPVKPAHALLVKYDPSGKAQWTRTAAPNAVSDDSPFSRFVAIVAASDGSVYVTGYVGSDLGTGVYDFGNNVTATAPGAVLVKYDSAGTAQWLRKAEDGDWNLELSSLALDSSNSVYVTGGMGSGVHDFGNGVRAQGALNEDAFTGIPGPPFPLVVKYDSAGVPLWARTVTTGGPRASFAGIAVDSAGNAYVVGSAYGPGPYDFGNGISVAAATAFSDHNMMVRYTSSGIADWATSPQTQGSTSANIFKAVAVDSRDNIYASGIIAGPGVVEYGNGVAVTVSQGQPYGVWDALLLKYR